MNGGPLSLQCAESAECFYVGGPQDDLMEDGDDLEESGFKEELREEIVSEGAAAAFGARCERLSERD